MDNNNGFFNDIKSKLLVLAAGLLSLSTLIQVFLNQIGRIFNWNAEISLIAFVGIYFFIPYALFLFTAGANGLIFSCVRRYFPKMTRNLNPLIPLSLDLVFLVTVLFFFATGGGAFTYTIAFFLILFSLSLFVFGIRLIGVSRNAENKVLKNEYSLLFGILSLLFFLFVLNSGRLNDDRNLAEYPAVKHLGFEVENEIFREYESIDSLKGIVDVAEELKLNQYYRLTKILTKSPEINLSTTKVDSAYKSRSLRLESYIAKLSNAKDDINYDRLLASIKDEANALSVDSGKSKEDIRQTNVNNKSIVNLHEGNDYKTPYPDRVSYRAFQTLSFFNEAMRDVVGLKAKGISQNWTKVIQNIQYKGLFWFYFLISLLLFWWFSNQIKANNRLIYLLKKNKPVDSAGLDHASKAQNGKNFFYLILMLCIPFFRQIEKVDLNKPFIDFGIGNFQPLENSYFPMSRGGTDKHNPTDDTSPELVEFKDLQIRLLALESTTTEIEKQIKDFKDTTVKATGEIKNATDDFRAKSFTRLDNIARGAIAEADDWNHYIKNTKN